MLHIAHSYQELRAALSRCAPGERINAIITLPGHPLGHLGVAAECLTPDTYSYYVYRAPTFSSEAVTEGNSDALAQAYQRAAQSVRLAS